MDKEWLLKFGIVLQMKELCYYVLYVAGQFTRCSDQVRNAKMKYILILTKVMFN